MNIALGFCFWDILALIVLLAVVIGFVIRTVNLNKQEKELEGTFPCPGIAQPGLPASLWSDCRYHPYHLFFLPFYTWKKPPHRIFSHAILCGGYSV